MLVSLLMLLLPVTQLVTSSNIHICIFRIVCLVTLLIFLHSLHLNTQLNVSTSVISSTLHSFLRITGIVSLTFVLLMFLFYFILFILFF